MGVHIASSFWRRAGAWAAVYVRWSLCALVGRFTLYLSLWRSFASLRVRIRTSVRRGEFRRGGSWWVPRFLEGPTLAPVLHALEPRLFVSRLRTQGREHSFLVPPALRIPFFSLRVKQRQGAEDPATQGLRIGSRQLVLQHVDDCLFREAFAFFCGKDVLHAELLGERALLVRLGREHARRVAGELPRKVVGEVAPAPPRNEAILFFMSDLR